MNNRTLILLLVIIWIVYFLLREEGRSYPGLPPKEISPQPKPKTYQNWNESSEEEFRAELLTKEPWKNIHPALANLQLVKKWRIRGHNDITIQKWINLGVSPYEYEFVEWIADDKAKEVEAWKLSNYHCNEPEWALSYFGSLETMRREWLKKPRSIFKN